MKLDRDKYLTKEEVERLLRATKTRVRVSDGGTNGGRKGDAHPKMARDFALLATCAGGGLRVRELCEIRIGDLRGMIGETVAERPGKIRVRRAKKKDARTGGPVYEELAIPETSRRAIADYLSSVPDAGKKAWDRLFPLTTRRAEQIFKLYAERAGLPSALSIHALRHARGVMLYAKHKDLKLVQGALGHAGINTTQIYLHTVDQDQKLSELDFNLGGEDVPIREDHAGGGPAGEHGDAVPPVP